MKLYRLFFIGMIFIPIALLATESLFASYMFAFVLIVFIYSIIMFIYLKSQYDYFNKDIAILIFIGNLLNGLIVTFASAILIAVLGMAYYSREVDSVLTHVSFVLSFLGFLAIVLIIWFFIFIKPFVNHLDKAIQKIKDSK